MSISDDRLATLAEGWEHQTGWAKDAEYSETCRDTAAALRELQTLRNREALNARFRGRPIDPERVASDFHAPSED